MFDKFIINIKHKAQKTGRVNILFIKLRSPFKGEEAKDGPSISQQVCHSAQYALQVMFWHD